MRLFPWFILYVFLDSSHEDVDNSVVMFKKELWKSERTNRFPLFKTIKKVINKNLSRMTIIIKKDQNKTNLEKKAIITCFIYYF
jgi:hypothetical protein